MLHNNFLLSGFRDAFFVVADIYASFHDQISREVKSREK